MDILTFLQAAGSGVWIYGGTFILVLSLLVFVHEWGHYIIARLCGVRVDSFSIGFGKEIWGFNDRNGTRWKISLIPLGGYVKMFGDTDPASASHSDKQKDDAGETRPMSVDERKRAFFAKPVGQRSAIVFAGPAINYIFAIILLAGLYTFQGKPVTPAQGSAIMAGSAAERAGFQPHDKILSINGKHIDSFEDIRREMMIALDESRTFEVQRGDQVLEIKARPDRKESEDRFGFKHSTGLLGMISPRHAVPLENITAVDGVPIVRTEGDLEPVRSALRAKLDGVFRITVKRDGEEVDDLIIRPSSALNGDLTGDDSSATAGEMPVLLLGESAGDSFVQFSPASALVEAGKEAYFMTRGTLEALGQIVTGVRSTKELGGVIRIGAMAGDVAQQGVIAVILFTALLSINLGLINLLPVPLLDGGHLVFYAFEAVFGRPIPEKIQEYAFRAGFVFLIGLMVFANLNDILQLIL